MQLFQYFLSFAVSRVALEGAWLCASETGMGDDVWQDGTHFSPPNLPHPRHTDSGAKVFAWHRLVNGGAVHVAFALSYAQLLHQHLSR